MMATPMSMKHRSEQIFILYNTDVVSFFLIFWLRPMLQILKLLESGLQITAGQWTMCGKNWVLTRQIFTRSDNDYLTI